VRSIEELWQGHLWRAEAPDSRSFLPRSGDGRWSWYRQINKGSMLVNFFREGGGSAPDQPTMAEWAGTPSGPRSFAAILGLPVDHSRTPCEHGEFFRARDTPVVRIPLGECTAASLDILAGLGLTHAAVTAPLKETMFGLCDDVVGAARDLGSVNTIMRRDGRWRGTNTDLAGVIAATEHVAPNAAVVLWGGGGTKATVVTAVPSAVPYSARTGQPRPGVMPLPPGGPDIVIWAVGRNRQPACQWPPAEWRPSEVIDLNYSDDSPGLEYAWRHGIAYRSGVEMFTAQAAQQREFWDGG